MASPEIYEIVSRFEHGRRISLKGVLYPCSINAQGAQAYGTEYIFFDYYIHKLSIDFSCLVGVWDLDISHNPCIKDLDLKVLRTAMWTL